MRVKRDRQRSGPRIQDVAKAAGVSVVTVSRAMNAPDTVSPKTHKKINDAIKAIDYVPDLMARSMATQSSRIVAAVVPTLREPIFVSMIQSLSDVLTAQGMQLLLGSYEYDLQKEEDIVTAALGRKPDALVLAGSTHTERLCRLLKHSGIPVLETTYLAQTPTDYTIGYDHFEAGYAITSHLIERGRRRIGYVGRPLEHNERALGKYQGFGAAIAEHGLERCDAWELHATTEMAAGARAVEKLIQGQGVDAILFSGDNTAAGAYLACLSAGISVPQDVSLCGFGDHEIGSLIPGGLTTVRTHSSDVGRISGEVILEELRGEPRAEKRIDVGFEVVIRNST